MKWISDDIQGYLFLLFIVFVCAFFTIFIIKNPEKSYSPSYWKLFDKNLEYEKILNAEFGRTIENYNEYLVYKIDTVGDSD